VNLIACGRDYSAQMLAILNEVIATTTALYDYKPRDMAMMASWFDVKERGSFPVIGLVDGAGKLLAFGSYGTFRAWPAYKYTVEHSVYVEKSFRRQGAGRLVLTKLIEVATAHGYHNMVAGIDAANQPSIALHQELGFELCGTVKHAGFKFGRWVDLQLHQLILPGPTEPVDDVGGLAG
jgi:L-amino acid N-acyltransferase YncA